MRTCHCLFEEKLRRDNKDVDLKLVQERVYYELEPHFVKSWNDLSADQKQSFQLKSAQFIPEGYAMPQLRECGLFRKKVCEILLVNEPELSLKDLRDVLDNIEDNDFLESSRFADMYYIIQSMKANPQTKKGVVVRDLLKAGFNQMKAGGPRSDSAPEWRHILDHEGVRPNF